MYWFKLCTYEFLCVHFYHKYILYIFPYRTLKRHKPRNSRQYITQNHSFSEIPLYGPPDSTVIHLFQHSLYWWPKLKTQQQNFKIHCLSLGRVRTCLKYKKEFPYSWVQGPHLESRTHMCVYFRDWSQVRGSICLLKQAGTFDIRKLFCFRRVARSSNTQSQKAWI